MPSWPLVATPRPEWIVQQLREAFPEAGPYRYVILDRGTKLDSAVITFLQAYAGFPEFCVSGVLRNHRTTHGKKTKLQAALDELLIGKCTEAIVVPNGLAEAARQGTG